MSAWLHWPRWPGSEAEPQGLYGLSYDRRLFERYGYFSPDLRAGEDTHFNRRVQGREVVRFGRGVLTLHRYPTSIPAMLIDAYRRGSRTPAILLDLTKPPASRLAGFRRRRVRTTSSGARGLAPHRHGRQDRQGNHKAIESGPFPLPTSRRCGCLPGPSKEAGSSVQRPRQPSTPAGPRRRWPRRGLRAASPRRRTGTTSWEAMALTRLDPPAPPAEVIAAFRRAAGLDPNAKEPHARLYAHLMERDPRPPCAWPREEVDRAPLEPRPRSRGGRCGKAAGTPRTLPRSMPAAPSSRPLLVTGVPGAARRAPKPVSHATRQARRPRANMTDRYLAIGPLPSYVMM